MILTRLGNKRNISALLGSKFPSHKMRIELFFGAGGSYFYLPKPQYAVLNDMDDDVTNLYLVLLEQKEELAKHIRMMPISQGMVKYWHQHRETDQLKKAVRFLFLSNFTYLGKGNTLRIGLDNTKARLLEKIEPTLLALKDVKITTGDFRNCLGKISFSNKILSKNQCFVYLDPVYLDTEHYYKVPKWTKDDTHDCMELMDTCGMRCGMSEFDHPFVIDQAKKRGFNIYPMKVRQNIKNRRREIYITNYEVNEQLTF